MNSLHDSIGRELLGMSAPGDAQTGAVAALLGEIGIPQEVMRGIAVVSRSGGLVGHIREEQLDPAARFICEMTEEQVPYEEAKT